MQIRPGTNFIVTLTGAPTGQEGVLQAGLLNLATDLFTIPLSTVGVDEIGTSGTYRKTFTAPDDEGDYLDIWTDGVTTATGDEIIEVMFTAPAGLPTDTPGSYASLADLDIYLEDGLPEGYDEDFLEKVLGLASNDIDRYATAWAWDVFPGLKFRDPDDQTIWRDTFQHTPWQDAIIRATCAQAEYRLARGDQFFVEANQRRGAVQEPRIGPKVAEELALSGFRARRRTVNVI